MSIPAPLDLSAYAGLYPYASELFGIYQPLLGWRARFMKRLVAREQHRYGSHIISGMMNDSRVHQLIRANPAPFSPDSSLPARVDDWLNTQSGRLVRQAATDFSRANGRMPRGAEWGRLVAELDLTGVVRSAAAASTREVTSSPYANLYREASVAGSLLFLSSHDTAVLDGLFSDNQADYRASRSFFNPLTTFQNHLRGAFLSPIGIIQIYRQYFFELDSFLGPPVGHVWVSPGGSLELYEVHTRRALTERSVEQSSEVSTRSERESSEETELATATREDNSRDMSLGVSASGGVNFGVAQASASANFSLNMAHKTGEEHAHKRARKQSEKLSNEMRRSLKTSFRTSVETTDTSSRRYVLTNTTEKLLNYELRRKMRRVGVQVQHIGTQLCWQVYLDEPGNSLGVAELVHVAQAEDLASTLPPPEAPVQLEPKESELQVDFPFEALGGDPDADDDFKSGNDGDGNTIRWTRKYSATPPAVGYKLAASEPVRQVSVDRVDPEEDAPNPVAASFERVNDNTFLLKLNAVNFQDQPALKFTLSLRWDPPDQSAATQAWQAQMAQYTESKSRLQQAEYVKAIRERIQLAGQVASRPSDDLREEERTVVFRRLISQLTQVDSKPGRAHVISELIRSIFDVDKMLYFVAPEWWAPRKRHYQNVGVAGDPITTLSEENRLSWGGSREKGRDNYLITEESAPAKMGASLGWLLQLDGDPLRNAFLNSPWVKAIIPIRPGKEKEAMDWLQLADVEGADGLDDAYAGTEPEYKDKTLRHVITDVAEKLRKLNEDMGSTLSTEQVFEKGFDPLKGGFQATGTPFEVFDQWVEVLPTDQVVAQEYGVPGSTP